MKSKNVFLFIVALAIIFFIASCGKSPLNYTGSKLATSQNCLSGVTYTYIYAANGNIASIAESYDLSMELFTYGSNNTVEEQNLNQLGVNVSGETYYTNSVGLADSGIGTGQQKNNSWSYSFNSSYYPMQTNYYTNRLLTGIDLYNVVGHNVSYIEHYDSTNHYQTYDYYTYYASNSNTLGNQAIGENFLGVQNGNLTEQDVQIGANLDTTRVIVYKYRYDTSARPDTMATYDLKTGALIDSFIYTYTD